MKLVLLMWTLVFVALSACTGDYEPTVRFATANCVSTPSEDTRERRVRTSCALRSGSINSHARPCIMWNHTTITERRHTLACQRTEWLRIER